MASNPKVFIGVLCIVASIAALYFTRTIGPETSFVEYMKTEALVSLQRPKSQRFSMRERENLTLEVNSFGQYDYEKVQKVVMQDYLLYRRQVKTKAVPMQNCNCTRNIEIPPGSWYSTSMSTDGLYYNMTNTTCSTDAFYRGSGQNIVGFTFFGNSTWTSFDGYYKGISQNLYLMRTFYPGWTMRLYYDLDDDHPAIDEICTLACSDSLLDLCHVGRLPGTPTVDAVAIFPRIWRFFPLLDPQVDILISRDLDSRFSWRESSAVASWLQTSEEPIHVMRDHHCGHKAQMLAGMWDAHLLRKSARTVFPEIWNNWMKSHLVWTDRKWRNADQTALSRLVWPWASDKVLQHDSYTCVMFNGSVPYPTKRIKELNNHVGCRDNFNEVYWRQCPEVCRPKDHQDWETC